MSGRQRPRATMAAPNAAVHRKAFNPQGNCRRRISPRKPSTTAQASRRNPSPVFSVIGRPRARCKGGLANAPEAAVAPMELTDRLGQISGGELGPHLLEEDDFGVSD